IVHVILDLKRVNEVDSTGARILLRIHDRLQQGGRHLLLSHLEPDSAVASMLDEMGVAAAVTPAKIFEDTDRALEWAEDRLLRDHHAAGGEADEHSFEEMSILEGLGERECATVRAFVDRRSFARGDVVFNEGDEGRELFFIVRGTASVRLQLQGGTRINRLATFSAGTVVGELALLARGPRSASIEADDDLVCYVLSDEAFDQLQKDHPAVAIKLVTNIGRELSRRLRRTNRTIYQLEG